MINHIYPDVDDRAIGIELSKIRKLDYPPNLLKARYKDYEEKKTVKALSAALYFLFHLQNLVSFKSL